LIEGPQFVDCFEITLKLLVNGRVGVIDALLLLGEQVAEHRDCGE
jgi:hypothetical protein